MTGMVMRMTGGGGRPGASIHSPHRAMTSGTDRQVSALATPTGRADVAWLACMSAGACRQAKFSDAEPARGDEQDGCRRAQSASCAGCALRRPACAQHEGLAAHDEAELGCCGGEQGQAHGRGGDQGAPGRLAVTRTSRARTGRPRRAKTFQIP